MLVHRSLAGCVARWWADVAGRGSRHHAALGGRRWALLRLRIFARDSWRCVKCKRAGRLECDHIVPLRRGGAEYDESNLQSLCRPCHIRKSASENRKPDPAREAWRKLVRALM